MRFLGCARVKFRFAARLIQPALACERVSVCRVHPACVRVGRPTDRVCLLSARPKAASPFQLISPLKPIELGQNASILKLHRVGSLVSSLETRAGAQSAGAGWTSCAAATTHYQQHSGSPKSESIRLARSFRSPTSQFGQFYPPPPNFAYLINSLVPSSIQ